MTPIPIISTIVTLIALASLWEVLGSDNNGSDTTERSIKKSVDCDAGCHKMRWHAAQINLFLVDMPCLLLFSFVFACYVAIWEEQGLHGWIVLAVTGSLALRFGVVFLTYLPILYFDWSHTQDFTEVCVTFGNRSKNVPFYLWNQEVIVKLTGFLF